MSTENNQVRYDAFISYRHIEPDKYVAEELHRQLETFKVPAKIRKNSKKKRISRIFRDKEELPITDNLEEPILQALKNSEYLIVICSKKLNESVWCKKEIQSFIKLHGQEKVMAVLADGEPGESFPPELLYREKCILAENGETKIIKEAIEPLAADVRGKDKKEIKKNIKEEMLRILAPMLECGYDDLRQRHRERKVRRILTTAFCITGIGLLIGTISTIMALQIHSQKNEIDRLYWETLKANAVMTSENALDKLEEGDRMEAIRMARELLPDNLQNQDKPFMAEVYYALEKSLYPYATGNKLVPLFWLEEDAQIEKMLLNEDGNKIALYTRYNNLTVWDMEDKKKCIDIDLEKIGDSYVSDRKFTFVGNDEIAVISTKNISIIDLEDNEEGKVTKKADFTSYGIVREVLSNANGEYLIIIFDQGISVLKTDDYKEIWHYELEKDWEMGYLLSRIYGENLIFCEKNETDENASLEVSIADIKTGEIKQRIKLKENRISQIEAGDGKLFIVQNGKFESTMAFSETTPDAHILCYDIITGAELWNYTAQQEYINSIVVPYQGYDCFLFESYGKITALYKDTGEKLGSFEYGTDIVKIFPLKNPDSYIVYTREGEYITLLPKENLNYEVEGRFTAVSDNIKDYLWGNGFVACLPYSSKSVTIYGWYQDEDGKELFTAEDSISEMKISDDGKYALLRMGNHMFTVMDCETNRVIAELLPEDDVYDAGFVENDNILVAGRKQAFRYDTEGTLLEKIPYEEEYFMYKGTLSDEASIYGQTTDFLEVIDLDTGKVKTKVSRELLNYDYIYAFNNKSDKCIIINQDEKTLNILETTEGTVLMSIDINATYVESIRFSEDDRYVYVVFEDNKVQQYDCESLTLKCEVDKLEYETEKIVEQVQGEETKIYFMNINGAYLLGEYEGVLKVEQFIPNLIAVDMTREEYRIKDYKTVYAFPMYTYEEMLGKADQICYDNSIWNN